MRLFGVLFVVSALSIDRVAPSLLSWLTGGSASNNGPLDTGRLAMYLNTRRNPSKAEALDVENPASVRSSKFLASKPVVVLIHGYSDLYSRSWWSDIVTEFLQAEDLNVFRLDWSAGNRPPYSTATTNAVAVGEYLSDFLLALVQAGVRPDHIYLVGHSLGCHLAGYAGKAFKKNSGSQIGRITGLDPAGPSFTNSPVSKRLDSSDATYVDTIVTDSGNYGSTTKMGHLNFYPNGGRKQPGCRQGLTLYNCNHARALGYFTESINNKACTMTGHICDSYEKFLQGGCNQCSADTCTPMGYHANIRIADRSRGPVSFYLTTSGSSPYCRI
ncbi:hypothetical protein RvY_04448 [Ramazzottius varieornatus]|uniref:Lipase domain-containing protein n=1 Tax=Ramazzottius varieornatus TaxID=947166 RepID=A0A1D1UYG0_RAMVA|nr:hypothetical protein RvY_04448 [Ramazzottius varieornatus]